MDIFNLIFCKFFSLILSLWDDPDFDRQVGEIMDRMINEHLNKEQ